MQKRTGTIAFVTDDGSTISSHFGRALYFEVVRLEEGKIVERKRLNKAGHHTFGAGSQGNPSHGQDWKHAAMIAPLSGVEVLVARGMGMGAREHLLSAGIRSVLTDLRTIDEAVEQFLVGTLADNPRRIHQHGPGHQR